MKKRLLSAILVLCIITMMLPISSLATEGMPEADTSITEAPSAEAEKFVGAVSTEEDETENQTSPTKISEPAPSSRVALTSGACGNNATWKLENGTLTIGGTGEMDSYFYNPNDPDDDSDPACSKAPWYSLRDQIKTIVITNGISKIGMSAFFGCSKLTNATIPDSVRFIDAYAFNGCSSLLNITLPNGLTDIHPYTFEGCVNLTKATIPDSVTTIWAGAFEGCSSLTSITLPKSLTSVGDHSFSYCSNLSTIIIPDSVTIIDNHAFAYCVKLKSTTIPHSVECIRWNAFTHCYELTDIYYGGSESEWTAISIDEGNEIFEQASIHFKSSDTPTFKNVYYYDTIAETGVNVDLFWNWNDLLRGDSSIYNERLAKMGVALSAVIEGANYKEETNKILVGEDKAKRLECDDVKYIETSPGMAIGIKTVKYSASTKYIVFIVLRGTTTELDVLNDLRSAIGVSDWGANSVFSKLDACLMEWSNTYGKIDSTNTKFFVTGHSLGGACANIVSARLSEKYNKNNVFAYTFAAPSPFTEKTQKEYYNIHNFLCFNDNVPLRLSTQDSWYGNGYYTWFYPEKSALTRANYTKLTKKMWTDTYNAHLLLRLHAPSIYMAFLMTNPDLNICMVNYIRVKCPVDMEIYNSDNKLVGRIINDEVDYNNYTSDVMLTVSEGAKYVYFLADDTYTIRFVGTGDGTMTYTAASKDANSNIDKETKVYSNVKIKATKTFKSTVSSYAETDMNNLVKIPDVELLVTDNNGSVIARVLPDTEATATKKDNGTEVSINDNSSAEQDKSTSGDKSEDERNQTSNQTSTQQNYLKRSPQTGDTALIMLYIGGVIISGITVLFGYFIKRRKTKYNPYSY